MSQLDEYLDMAQTIAMSGEQKFTSVHGRFGTYYVKEVEGFEYRAQKDSLNVEVMNLENSDPFISRWADGRPCRCHLGRYHSLDKIKEHYDSL